MSDHELRIFSLNCWGLKYVSKNRTERIAAIASFLERSQYDIVALQELWVYADYQIVRVSVSKHLPYAKFFYSGALGAGLAIFSRFPIIAAAIQPYSLNGSPLDVKAGDWFVGKAAASVLITHPILGQVQVFNTHLFAKGGEGGPEHHRAHRLVNAWEFAKLARQSAEIGRYVIAAGDFNSIPTTLPMTVIREHGALSDAWETTHPPNASMTSLNSVLSPKNAIETLGVTADSPLNSYSADKPLDVHARASHGKRLDYVLFRNPAVRHSSFAPSGTMPILAATESRVLLTENVPGKPFAYSDHFGLEATLVIKYPEAQENTLPNDGAAAGSTVSTDPAPATGLDPPRLTETSATAVLQALTACFQHARRRSRNELLIFIICVVLLSITIVTSSWNRQPSLAPLLVFFGGFVTWLGTTLFYSGFVYGNWEVNALMNIIEELELYRRSVDVGLGRAGGSDYFKR
ncbi:inositol phosphophingolipids phospholipase C [Auriscalpium vulgare]|uniref:Inositol phosphophingolipids phospholipase C n=1 Tax=Auriscalpium vulgare TaxID=40419 RepID=A0ACB8SAI8_9AGAM|nr:inositol phosphophingolipids phospholipase C [Auriscalpium vulgare]